MGRASIPHGGSTEITNREGIMKKLLLIGGVLIVVVIAGLGGVAYYIWSNLDSLIKTAIEEVGTRATQTQVKLDGVKVSPTSGSGKLSGLTIANPKDFKTPSAFKLGEISLALDTNTVMSNTIVVKEVVIAAPQVTYELSNSGGSNIQAIQRNIDSFVKQYGGTGASTQPAAKSDPASEKKLVIENLYVRGGKVEVSASALGGKTVPANLPDIHLKDLGKSKGGATPAEIADQIIDAIGNNATKAVASLNLDALKGAAGQALQNMQQGTGGATDAAKKATEGAGGALRNLLPGQTK
jgi:uncharacterized protein involved in outer membrane biogenesis